MFALYAVPIGLVIGWLAGGSVGALGRVPLRWGWVAVVGLLLQVILFADPVAARVGDLGAGLYVASSVLVFVAVLRNVRLRGVPLVAAGALANLVAIAANGGYMPASADALAALGKTIGTAYSNSALLAHPALAPLTDIFALPREVPFANVFSVGDVMIASGIAWVLVAGMRAGGASGNLGPTSQPGQYEGALGQREPRG